MNPQWLSWRRLDKSIKNTIDLRIFIIGELLNVCYDFTKNWLQRFTNRYMELALTFHSFLHLSVVYFLSLKVQIQELNCMIQSFIIIELVSLSVPTLPWTHNNLNCSKFHFGMLKSYAKWSVIANSVWLKDSNYLRFKGSIFQTN